MSYHLLSLALRDNCLYLPPKVFIPPGVNQRIEEISRHGDEMTCKIEEINDVQRDQRGLNTVLARLRILTSMIRLMSWRILNRSRGRLETAKIITMANNVVWRRCFRVASVVFILLK